ncbi:ssDNA binding protein [Synechococcus phage ACG-2014f]|uniref:Single-stranded DNA-binding protein n=1 Tax=Synechococcus phage ACG-2014f TaxID=1493511 RepID=A0A0E3FQR5_9CAUD|nr:ssDNA binding protein [Synechococcus phage ACG-2014f]
MSFANLKKQSSLGSLTEKLVKEVEKMNNTQSGGEDDRYWKLTCDKSQNGYAVIRFLPAPDSEDMPFVKLYSHAFQSKGGWFIENSLTTLNQKDPVSEYNSELWNNGTEAGKEQARKQKRKLTYIANIYVVKDPANPDNEGRVFLYKFGKKIFDKLMSAMQPEFEDEDAINPFDFWEGANFNLKAKSVAGYRNYDSSGFGKVTALNDDDEVLEGVWKKEHSLAELVAPDQFKDYETLKKRMNQVLGLGGTSRPAPQEDSGDEENIERQLASSKPSFRREESSYSEPESFSVSESSVEDDETLSYFQSLAD